MNLRSLAAGSAILAATCATALDIPPMKSGLWESKITREGSAAPPRPIQMCADEALQKEMLELGLGAMKSMCSKQDFRRDGLIVHGSAECKLGESNVKSTSVTTFFGDVAYRTETRAVFDPPFMGRATSTTLVESKWTGPCPATMKPGDVMLPDGRTMNMRAMGAPPPPPPAPPAPPAK